MSESPASPVRLRQLASAFMGARVLQVAVELGVFTVLARGSRPAHELTEQLHLHPRGAVDFLDALVALGLLERENGIYRNTPDCDLFLDRDKPSYIGAAIELSGLMYTQWTQLPTALRSGKPSSEWTDRWSERYRDPEYLRIMRQAMTTQSLTWVSAFAAKYPWQTHKSFVDVGTAEGALPIALARAHPELKGIGFDLPPVGSSFEAHVAQHGLSDRLKFQGGNFFNDPLPTADVIVLSGVLHSWGPDARRTLLDKARAALPTGGLLIVRDGFVDPDRRATLPLLLSLHMLVDSAEGSAFTTRDCQKWIEEAGFVDVKVELLDATNAIVVGKKPG